MKKITYICKKYVMKKKLILTIFFATICLMFSCKKSSSINAQNQQNPSVNKVTNQKDQNNTNEKFTVLSGKVNVLTSESFKYLVFDYETNTQWNYKGNKPAIVDFYADWCRPCKMIAPIMEELAVDYKDKIIFYKINVDENPAVSRAFGIQSIPSVLFIPVKGQPQMAIGAMTKEGYKQAIKQVFNIN